MNAKAQLQITDNRQVVTCAKELDPKDCGFVGGQVCGKCGAVPTAAKTAQPEIQTTDETPDVFKDARDLRLKSLGVAEGDTDSFLCAFERKVYPGNSQPCAGCPGGCVPEQGLPSLLSIEGLAEQMFDGKVLDSGYGDQADLFLVDMERKDGRVIEIVFDGTSGECQGWRLLNQEISQKSAQTVKVISMNEAQEIALKSVQGEVVAVEADSFEGYDAWVVEIDSIDGKSYDVFVGLSGEVLGHDEYEKKADPEGEEAPEDEAEDFPPIEDEEDLKLALAEYEAEGSDALKLHITEAAEALELTEMLPWKSDEEAPPEETEGEPEGEPEEKVLPVDDAEFLADLAELERLALEVN